MAGSKQKRAPVVVEKEEEMSERPQIKPRRSSAWMVDDADQEVPNPEVTVTATTPIKVVQMS